MVEISTITNHEAMVGTSAVFIVPSVEEATKMVTETLNKVFKYDKLDVAKIDANHALVITGYHNNNLKEKHIHTLWLRTVGEKTYLVIPLLAAGLSGIQNQIVISEFAFADQFCDMWLE
jgi:hypothetical protein